MSDLAEFLLARIAEDEETAKNVLRWGKHSNYYRQPGVGFDRWTVRRHEESVLIEAHLGIFRPSLVLCVHYLDGDLADHIARWDPARVLAECEAKRRIVEAYRGDVSGTPSVDAFWYAMVCAAAPYADHPDYDPAWQA
jgi:hypothetical protein